MVSWYVAHVFSKFIIIIIIIIIMYLWLENKSRPKRAGLSFGIKFSGPPSKDGPTKNSYTWSERRTVRCSESELVWEG